MTQPTTLSRRRLLQLGAGIGTLAISGTVLSACTKGSASGGDASSPTSISFLNRWSDPASKSAAEDMFAGFTKATGITVANQTQPNSGATYQPAVRTAFSSSNPPTLATDIAGPEIFNLAKSDVLMDLTDFYNSTIKSRAQAGATAGSVLNDKVWGLSSGASIGNLIWYNQDYLDQYKVTASTLTDTDSWMAAMTEIKNAGGQPIIIGAKDQWPGGHYLNDIMQRRLGSTKVTALYNRTVVAGAPDDAKWTDAQVIKSFQDYVALKPLFQKGFLGEAQGTTDGQFLGGKAGFYEMGSWLLQGIKSTPPKFTPGVMLYPAVTGGEGAANEITLANGTIIASQKANTDAVHKFFDYFTQPDQLATWAASQVTFMPYTFDTGTAEIAPATVKQLFTTISGFSAAAGPDGAALYNDEAIDVNIYTQYIWQGSVGLMSGDITSEKLAQQLEDATVKAQQKLS